MNKIYFYLFIILITFFSCHRSDYNEALSIYENNKSILNEIIGQMQDYKLYTRIDIRKKSLIEKIFSFNFENTTIVIISNFNNNNILKSNNVVSKDNFSGLPEKYFEKINHPYSENEITTLNRILSFMYNNDIDVITMKTPELSHIDLVIGFQTGLYYKISNVFESNIISSEKISGDWYFVEYKLWMKEIISEDTTIYLTYYSYDEAGNRYSKTVYKYLSSDNPTDTLGQSDVSTSEDWELDLVEIYSRDVSGKEIAIYKNNEVLEYPVYGFDIELSPQSHCPAYIYTTKLP